MQQSGSGLSLCRDLDLTAGGLYEAIQLLDHVTFALLQCTLPDKRHAPAQAQELGSHSQITLNISLDFLGPKLGPCGRNAEVSALPVSMPEASMHKYHCAPLVHDDVWRARKVTFVQPKSIPKRMQASPDLHLWLGVFPTDRSHHP